MAALSVFAVSAVIVVPCVDPEPIREVVESDESVVILCWRLIREGERPMWKPEHRIAADGSGLRYPSDLTGAEWAVVEPMVPPAKPGGRKRTIDVREILNGIFYVLWTGCQWQALPKDLPPKSTVWAYFDLWVREQAGREASPTTAIIDSQSVKGAQKGGLARPAGLRCGQEDHGSQAPYPRRYAQPVVERSGPCRQYSGSRWSGAGARPPHASFVPVH